MPKSKVFCIGYQKTGTTSMEHALQILGYRVAGVFGRNMRLGDLKRSFVEIGLKTAARHDAVQDMPWPLMFRELDAAFPGSRFVLTVRDTDSWCRSICSHFGTNPGPVQALAYGEDTPAPVGHEEHYKQVYEAHNREVLDYFRDRPGDLLTLDLEQGDGWDKLCPFLGVEIPDAPFARANAASGRRSLIYRLRRHLDRLRPMLGGARA